MKHASGSNNSDEDHRPLKVLVATLPGTCDPSLAIAASRGGGVGLLDLSLHNGDLARCERAIGRLNRLAKGEKGLVVQATVGEVEAAASKLSQDLDYVLLVVDEQATDDPSQFDKVIELWQSRAKQIGIVLAGTADLALADHPAVDFVVAKGNEAGGLVGEETSFVLLQRLLKRQLEKPVYVWGGIGFHTAAACCVAGVAGVVLDWQLALMRESPLPAAIQQRIRRMDGTETVVIPLKSKKQLRVYHQGGMTAKEQLENALEKSVDNNGASVAWQDTVTSLVHASKVEDRLWLIGQDACWASQWAETAPTVGRAISHLCEKVSQGVEKSFECDALAEGGPLAQSHGTTFPIAQGPMTRVSDVPEFCQAVEKGGGLPFLALAMLRGPEVRKMLAQTSELMGDRSWGVGILGFVPLELRNEQLAVVEEVRPPYAIIAGGRPDQAAHLEGIGIHTYLHVPSPVMLDIYIQEGARRFIFEGRECGGHVGPRSSFVLWESMIEILSTAKLSAEEAANTHVLFAGGICDGLSGAMVTALAQPLIERGMKVGVLLGTAYLFTQEATATGAIVDTFQEMASKTDETVIIQSSPGHAIRCVQNEYTDSFHQEKSRLLSQNKSSDEIREVLERDQLGRLRIASKGVQRAGNGNERRYVETNADQQRRNGMYMIGQVAPMCEPTGTIRQLHERVSNGTVDWLTSARTSTTNISVREPSIPAPPPLDIAVVGMSCLLPGADTPEEFWQNILEKRDLLEEVPSDRFDVDRWFDASRETPDKVNSKSGGFLKAIPFDPLKFGIPPASLHSIEPVQLLALELVDRALTDAGYGGYQGDNPYKQRSSIILGAGGGAGELSTKYVFRAALPQYFGDVAPALLEQLPEWTEDSFAGILMNVIAGRVANRFDFGGVNFTVDAACASSLASIYLACRELSDGTSDMVIAGGVDTGQTPFGYLCFATAGALSPRGKSRPFDQSADGIAISEGLASVVLKRLTDAERDGDRIYSIIRAAAGGSDGRSKGMTAPRTEGQVRTFQRAYHQARFSPASVELFEAHGTGTAVGDRTECQSLNQILQEGDAPIHASAIGSVKSNIGHTKCAAGVAGLMKASLSLYHRVLPPTIHVDSLDPEGPLVQSPLYANTELRPWVRTESPRRAGVSSFGFGGTNFHVVMQEYEEEALNNRLTSPRRQWSSELCIFSAKDELRLLERIQQFSAKLDASLKQGNEMRLADIAFTLFSQSNGNAPNRAAIVAKDPDDLLKLLQILSQHLTSPVASRADLPVGINYTDKPLGGDSPLAMLFPGQGSQSPNMLRDLAVEFSEVRDCLERADGALKGSYDRPLSRFIYPVPTLLDHERAAQVEAIKATHVAQPALGVCGVGAMRLLDSLGIRPAVTAGHSYGELVALHAAGSLDEESLYRLSHARGRAMTDIAKNREHSDLGSMMAVAADEQTISKEIELLDEVWIANLNSPTQTVISGTNAGLKRAERILADKKISCLRLPVACAFHTPIMAPAKGDFEQALRQTEFSPPRIPVFANVDAAEYANQPNAIRGKLSEQLLSPVQFVDLIENMYASGSRVFLEVGPGDVLSRLLGKILADKPHVHIATQPRSHHGVDGLLHSLGELFAHQVDMELDRLFTHRNLRVLDFAKLSATPAPSPANHCWLVDGAHSRPLNESSQNSPPQLAVVNTDEIPKNHTPAEVSSIGLNQTLDQTASLPEYDKPHDAGLPPTSVPANFPTLQAPASKVVTTVNNLDPSASDESYTDPYHLFQETMRKFLETQQVVMTSYLSGTPVLPEQHKQTVLPTAVEAPPSHDLPSAYEQTDSSRSSVDSNGVAPPRETPPEMPSPIVEVQEEPAEELSTVAEVSVPTQDLTQTLVGIVSERTGYPADMLDPEINLESELGIDSIKRVEIIAAFRRSVIPQLEEPPAWFMEKMTAAKSIDEIAAGLKQLVEAMNNDQPVELPTPSQNGTATAPAKVAYEELPRCVVEVIDAPLREIENMEIPTAGVIVVTGDGHGIAEKFASELVGATVEILNSHSLTSREAAIEALNTIRQRSGEIAGFLHLGGLQPAPPFSEMDTKSWFRCVNEEVKSTLFLLQAMEAELTAGSFFACVSTGSGNFEKAGQEVAQFPWRGGQAGMLKCAAKEWPQSRFRAIDINQQMLSDDLVRKILDEWKAEGPVEIGYRNGRRLGLQAVHATLSDAAQDSPTLLNSQSVVLILGGARGITAQIAIDMAQQVCPTLVLVGRSPQPELQEDPRTAGIEEHPKLRQALLEQAHEAGIKVIPKDIESQLRTLLAAREIRETLKAIADAGSTVVYESCDVRDSTALEQLVAEVQKQHGPINAVLHGAGVIEDKYIIDKTPESFDRVVETKTAPAITLARLLDPEQIKLFMLFSSVAGFYGNPGQSDYAAANEMLNRLASYLNHQWPGKVVAMNWGPWSGAGMVTPEVAKQFDSRGIGMVSVSGGQRAAWLETLNPNSDDVSVLIGAGPWVTNPNGASHRRTSVGANSDAS